ncbi:hypothetical protein CHS0354_042197 [Potamilus streckersoni]|uniref:Uncharacterized protein n=1 Tax=Potamilus streckersoni TaxID=2493646 RepID=A0AAE0TM64_9BIVA|nr:hypothetical protein CHS0354_042197 [Potamilus streckersoni]
MAACIDGGGIIWEIRGKKHLPTRSYWQAFSHIHIRQIIVVVLVITLKFSAVCCQMARKLLISFRCFSQLMVQKNWMPHTQPVACLHRRHHILYIQCFIINTPSNEINAVHILLVFFLNVLHLDSTILSNRILSFLCNPCESGILMFTHDRTKSTSTISTLDFKTGKTRVSFSTPAEGPT